jgi:hypothetical protein
VKGWGITVVAAAGLLAGCGMGGPGRIEMSGVPNISCRDMSGGACTEQAQAIAARHPGATDLSLDCSVAACDRKGGSGTAVVTLRDGSRVPDTFAYSGDPAPVPDPVCVEIDPVECGNVAAGQVADVVPPSKAIVRIEVTCTSATCTEDAGETCVAITLGDGSVQQSTVGWQAME